MLFREVVGQEKIKRLLIRSVQENRVSHAQLFLGESGTGALPLALAYAQYVNCEKPGPEDSCGECRHCRANQQFEYPDLHFSYPVVTKKAGEKPVSLDYLKEWKAALREDAYLSYNDWMAHIKAENKQGNITAEECRDIIRKLSLKPLYEGYKVLLMWLPEYLGHVGNMLLKILEEPPAGTLFLLVGEEESKVLTTILSRTQMLRIPRLSDEEVRGALQSRYGATESEAAQAALLAEGNLHKAAELLKDQENNFTEQFVQWMRLCFKLDVPNLMKWVEDMSKTGRENQKSFLLYCLALVRECFLRHEGLTALNRVPPSEAKFVQDFAPFVGMANINELVKRLSESHYYVERNANPKILFFNVSLHIHSLLMRQKAANAQAAA